MVKIGDILIINDKEYFVFRIKKDVIYLMTTKIPLSILLVRYNDKIEIINDKKEIIELLS